MIVNNPVGVLGPVYLATILFMVGSVDGEVLQAQISITHSISSSSTGNVLKGYDRIQHVDDARLEPTMLFSFGSIIGKGLQVVGSILGVIHKTSSDRHTEKAFQNVFASLDRNLQAIANVDETIDVMMTKSIDAIGKVDKDLGESTAEILSDVDRVGDKVDRNYGYLLKVFKIASETYTAVEKVRYEMHEEFRQVLENAKNSRIAQTVTKLNNFINYYNNEKTRISQLSRDDRIATLREQNGFLQHLRESRTPTGDSLESFLFEMIQQGYAIPENANDPVSYAALNGLYYGVQTYISVMRYLVKMNIYLADDSYRNRDINKYNDHMENVVTDFKSFSDTLLGVRNILDQVKGIFIKVSNLSFIANNTIPPLNVLKQRVENLEREKLNLNDAILPIIQEVPGKLMPQIKFGTQSLKTPLGPWKAGAEVRYAVQYRSDDNWYSKVGEWSEPISIEERANPILKVPAHSTYTRLIFRKFNNKKPQFVGILKKEDQSDFRDVDRDLFDAAAGSDESKAVQEVWKLISIGANPLTTFDLGRNALHAAAMNGNTNVATFLQAYFNTIESRDSNGYTPLHVAAEGGWANFINMLVQKQANINAKTKSGATPLHLAVANGYPLAVKRILETPSVDVNAQDNYGSGALHKAVLNGVEDILHMLLIDNRTQINLKSDGNFTATHLSAVLKNSKTAEMMLGAHGMKINTRSDGNMTALHLATISGNLPVVKQLLDLDATNINARSVEGWTPLHYAISLKRGPETAAMLERNDLIVNVPGARKVTPLHIAVSIGDINAVETLLSHGADLEQQTAEGLNAFHLAVVNDQQDVVNMLVQKGVDINSRTTDGSTALHLLAGKGNLPIVRFMLGLENVLISPRRNDMKTPLAVAQRSKHTEVARLLKLKVGNVRDEQLIYAAQNGLLEEVKSLIMRGANVDGQVNHNHTDKLTGWSPLEIAVGWARLDVVRYLVEQAGADVDMARDDGVTILHEAAWHGVMPVVQYVAEVVSDVNARDANGATALAYAAGRNYPDVVEFLKTKGAVN